MLFLAELVLAGIARWRCGWSFKAIGIVLGVAIATALMMLGMETTFPGLQAVSLLAGLVDILGVVAVGAMCVLKPEPVNAAISQMRARMANGQRPDVGNVQTLVKEAFVASKGPVPAASEPEASPHD